VAQHFAPDAERLVIGEFSVKKSTVTNPRRGRKVWKAKDELWRAERGRPVVTEPEEERERAV
jgi:hypothetical protein